MDQLITLSDGATLAVYEEGAGDPPFVFVHGLACNHTSWQPQFAEMAKDHRCLNIDLRGRGGSSTTPPYDTTRQADDIAEAMTAVGMPPSIVAGHSLGGITALVLNERHPELVLGVVLGDSPVRKGGMAAGPLIDQLRAAGSTVPLEPLLEVFWGSETTPAIKEYVREVMLGCPAEVAAGMLEESPQGEAMTALVKLVDQKPFMAIWAERALGDPAWLRETTVFARQEPIAGAGHFFQLERPEVTNALLRAFADDVENDPRIAK